MGHGRRYSESKKQQQPQKPLKVIGPELDRPKFFTRTRDVAFKSSRLLWAWIIDFFTRLGPTELLHLVLDAAPDIPGMLAVFKTHSSLPILGLQLVRLLAETWNGRDHAHNTTANVVVTGTNTVTISGPARVDFHGETNIITGPTSEKKKSCFLRRAGFWLVTVIVTFYAWHHVN